MKRKAFLIFCLLSSVMVSAQSYNFNQAVSAYNVQDYEKALDFLNRDLTDNPKHSESYCYRALIYCNQDKNAEALTDVNNAIKYATAKHKASVAYCFYVRAKIYNKVDENQQSIADLTVSIKNAPTDPDYYIERARLYLETKEFTKAELDFRKVLKLNEGDVRAWLGLGWSYYDQKRYEDADRILTQLTKLSPNYSEGFYYKAKVEFEQKKYDDAIEDAFHALALDESNSKTNELFLSYAEKNYALSLSKLNAQIMANPQKDSWYIVRANLLDKKEDYLLAISDYNKVMELNDLSYRSTILPYRANCFSELGNYPQAIADYDESLLANSTQAYVFGSRGNAKRLMGYYVGAVEDFTRAISIEPNETWFYYMRGWVKDEFMKDTQGGMNDYNQAIVVDKNFAYTYLNRGRLYEKELKETLKAKADYTIILALDTVVKRNSNCRQYALFHLGRIEEAVSWSNKIIETYPTSGNYYDAACLYAQMNKLAESIASLKHAFENGYTEFVHLSTDDDLENVRNLPDFKALVKVWQVKNDKSKVAVKNLMTNEPKVLVEEPESVTLAMKNISFGTYEIKCQINELPLNFLFDTGASDISISQTEVNFMLKNGYLDKTDILGSQSYQYANGESEVGTKIMLRKVNLGGFILRNVSASVVHSKNAPLLIGQSALGKYGRITIDNEKKTITIINKR